MIVLTFLTIQCGAKIRQKIQKDCWQTSIGCLVKNRQMLMKCLHRQFSIYINISYTEMICRDEAELFYKLMLFIDNISQKNIGIFIQIA